MSRPPLPPFSPQMRVDVTKLFVRYSDEFLSMGFTEATRVLASMWFDTFTAAQIASGNALIAPTTSHPVKQETRHV